MNCKLFKMPIYISTKTISCVTSGPLSTLICGLVVVDSQFDY